MINRPHRQKLPGQNERGTYRYAEHVTRTRRCAICKGALGVFPVGEGKYAAACYEDANHEATEPYGTKDELREKVEDLEQRQHQRHTGKSNLDPELRDMLRKGMFE